MRTLPDLSVYLVLDADLCGPRGMVATARAAVAGGVHAVQLRHKTSTNAEMISLGHALMAALDGTPGRVIINDNVEAACAIGAHGLHIGQGDMPAADARARIGAGPILGVSVETLDAAGISPNRISKIVFVGGSSLLQSVEAAMVALFPDAALERGEAFTAVADGLALAAGPS
jgi:thiamine-phosphate pyrophosphorylase